MAQAFVFGLTLGIAIGPIALIILNQGLTRGIAAGLQSAAGASLADLVFALVAFSLGQVVTPYLLAHRGMFTAIAGMVLMALGTRIATTGLRTTRGGGTAASPTTRNRSPFFATFGLTILNPLTMLGFAAFGARFLGQVSWASVLANSGAAGAGTLVVNSAIGVSGSALARLLQEQRALGWLNVFSGAAVAAFGLVGLFQ